MSALPETVLHASVQGAVLTVIVLVTFAAIPRVPAHVRAWVWWLVTARLVWALLPVPSLEIPLPLAVPSWLPGEVASRVAPAFESARGAPRDCRLLRPSTGPSGSTRRSRWATTAAQAPHGPCRRALAPMTCRCRRSRGQTS